MTAVLLTRPADLSAALAAKLETYAVPTFQAPLLVPELLDPAVPPLDAVQAFVFSSQQAVMCFAELLRANGIAANDIPTFCVGATTAAAARKAGFQQTHNANGNQAALLVMLLKQTRPEDGIIVYVRGADVAGDIAEALARHKYRTESTIVYRMRTVETLSDEIVDSLYGGEIGFVMLYSQRTAEALLALSRTLDFANALTQIGAVCMSEQIADTARGVHWRSVRVAGEPTEDAMIKALLEAMSAIGQRFDMAGGQHG